MLCLDAANGKILWKHEYPVTYSISYPAGPRCTPAVDGEFVYALGAEGSLWCYQRETGKIIWSHSLKDKYRTKSAIWGYASHPLIDGEKLIWGCSPPVIIQSAKTRQLILMSSNWIAAIDPESDKEFWTEEYWTQISNHIAVIEEKSVGFWLKKIKIQPLEMGFVKKSSSLIWMTGSSF